MTDSNGPATPAPRTFARLKTVLARLWRVLHFAVCLPAFPVAWAWVWVRDWLPVRRPTAAGIGGELATAARADVAAIRAWTSWQKTVLILVAALMWGWGWTQGHWRATRGVTALKIESGDYRGMVGLLSDGYAAEADRADAARREATEAERRLTAATSCPASHPPPAPSKAKVKVKPAPPEARAGSR